MRPDQTSYRSHFSPRLPPGPVSSLNGNEASTKLVGGPAGLVRLRINPGEEFVVGVRSALKWLRFHREGLSVDELSALLVRVCASQAATCLSTHSRYCARFDGASMDLNFGMQHLGNSGQMKVDESSETRLSKAHLCAFDFRNPELTFDPFRTLNVPDVAEITDFAGA